MIVQSATTPDSEHFVITMDEHTAFAAQLALAFGNERFEPVSPPSNRATGLPFSPGGESRARSVGPNTSQTACTLLLTFRQLPTFPSRSLTSQLVPSSAARCPPAEPPIAEKWSASRPNFFALARR